ncbi:MAG TPA: hypothetical protein VJA21_28490, partial [Verrucomicrobiae bacterium]
MRITDLVRASLLLATAFGIFLPPGPAEAQPSEPAQPSPAPATYPALPSETPTNFERATSNFDYVK